jgi:hypothetical protein
MENTCLGLILFKLSFLLGESARANVPSGINPDIIAKSGFMLGKTRDWENPFGDGKAGERIVRILVEEHERGSLKPRTTNTLAS